jgi:hypothetical protein
MLKHKVIIKIGSTRCMFAHGITKGGREVECMEELEYGVEALDQFAMFVPISFEHLDSVLK